MSDIETIRKELFGKGRWTFGGDGSHWGGCEETHWDCALVHLTARIAELEGVLKKIAELENKWDAPNDFSNELQKIAQEVLK